MCVHVSVCAGQVTCNNNQKPLCEKRKCAWNMWRSPPGTRILAFVDELSPPRNKHHTLRDLQQKISPSATAELSGWAAADTLLTNAFLKTSLIDVKDSNQQPSLTLLHVAGRGCPAHPLPVWRPPFPSPGLPREEPVPETSLVLLLFFFYILIFLALKKNKQTKKIRKSCHLSVFKIGG